MEQFNKFGMAAGVLFWLAASPASADLATPDAGSEQGAAPQVVAALQALAGVLEGAETVSETSTLVSHTRSVGPANAPFSSQGVDSSRGPVASGASLPLQNSSWSQVETRSAAAPAPAPSGGGAAVAVSSPPAVDLPSLAVSSAPSSLVLAESVEDLPTNTPIPGSLLLLGGGLLGILPLRPSLRRATRECRA